MKQESIQALAVVAAAAALFLFAGTGATSSATSEWTMLLSGLGLVTLGLTRRRPRNAGSEASGGEKVS